MNKHWLDLYCEEHKITIYILAQKTKLNNQALYKVRNNNTEIQNCSYKTLVALANYANITVEQLLEKYKNIKKVVDISN